MPRQQVEKANSHRDGQRYDEWLRQLNRVLYPRCFVLVLCQVGFDRQHVASRRRTGSPGRELLSIAGDTCEQEQRTRAEREEDDATQSRLSKCVHDWASTVSLMFTCVDVTALGTPLGIAWRRGGCHATRS